jgi:MerR family transcriptional regulator, redox-sensitive transcriptional activator SoxR
MDSDDLLTIGEVARRSGVAPSALRFYESRGLIGSTRTTGNQRRYRRATLRRVAVIKAAQEVGLSLADIGASLGDLPEDRTPVGQDWARLSLMWRDHLDGRIAELLRLRDELSDCIGCGCLSLKSCGIFNPADTVASAGAGARYLLGDEKPGVTPS